MEPDDSAAQIRLLVSIATHQHTINEDLRTWITEHRTIHEDLQGKTTIPPVVFCTASGRPWAPEWRNR